MPLLRRLRAFHPLLATAGMRRARCLPVFAAIPVALSGCLPYTMGSTARTVAPGETAATASLYFLPNAVEDSARRVDIPLQGLDGEFRWGLDDRSDIGMRFTNFSGGEITYKHELFEPTDTDHGMLSVQVGCGVVNLGEHALFDLALLGSGPEGATFTPYGGLRVMQVAPLNPSAVHDTPTAGGFLGLRIGDADLGVSPEVGIYYDHSSLGLRKGNLLIVPAISVHGADLIRTIFH